MKFVFSSILIVSSILTQCPAQADVTQRHAADIALDRAINIAIRLTTQRLATDQLTFDYYNENKGQYLIRIRDAYPLGTRAGYVVRACDVLVQLPNIARITHCEQTVSPYLSEQSDG